MITVSFSAHDIPLGAREYYKDLSASMGGCDHDLNEVVQFFESALRLMGYKFDGCLDIVPEEEPIPLIAPPVEEE